MYFNRRLKKILYLFGFSLVFILSIIGFLTIYLSYQETNYENYLKKTGNFAEVKINNIKFGWNLIYLNVKIDDLYLEDKQNNKLKIKYLKAETNLIRLIFSRKKLLDYLIVDNLSVFITKDKLKQLLNNDNGKKSNFKQQINNLYELINRFKSVKILNSTLSLENNIFQLFVETKAPNNLSQIKLIINHENNKRNSNLNFLLTKNDNFSNNDLKWNVKINLEINDLLMNFEDIFEENYKFNGKFNLISNSIITKNRVLSSKTKLNLERFYLNKQIKLDNIQTKVDYNFVNQTHSIRFEKLYSDNKKVFENLYLAYYPKIQQNYNVNLILHNFNVDNNIFSKLDYPIFNFINKAKFSGYIKNLALNLKLQKDWSIADKFNLNAYLENINFSKVGSIPGFKNISGHIKLGDKGGYLKLNTKNFKINLPIYSNGILFNIIKSKLNFNYRNNNIILTTNNLKGFNNKEQINGNFKFDIKSKRVTFDINLAFKNIDSRHFSKYTPNFLINVDKLINNNLQQGKIDDGYLNIKADFGKNIHRISTTANLQLSNIIYNDKKNLPKISASKAEIAINNSKVRIKVNKPYIEGLVGNINKAKLNFDFTNKSADMMTLMLDFTDLNFEQTKLLLAKFSYTRATSELLNDVIPFEKGFITGVSKVNFDLNKIKKESAVLRQKDIDLTVSLVANEMKLKDKYFFPINRINTKLTFSFANGLEISYLEGYLNDESFHFDFTNNKSNKQIFYVPYAWLYGFVPSLKFTENYIQGQSVYTLSMEINEQKISFYIDSEMIGTEFKIPSLRIEKPKINRNPLFSLVELNYLGDNSGELNVKVDFVGFKIKLKFGSKKNNNPVLAISYNNGKHIDWPKLPQIGWYLKINTSYLNYNQSFKDFSFILRNYFSNKSLVLKNNTKFFDKDNPLIVKAQIDNFKITKLTPFKINLNFMQTDYSLLNIYSDHVKGKLEILENTKQIVVNLDHLYLTTEYNKNNKVKLIEKNIKGEYPEIPLIIINIKDFSFDDIKFGSLKAQTYKNDNKQNYYNALLIKTKSEKIITDTLIDWNFSDKKLYSKATSNMVFKNSSKNLKKAVVSIHADWPGSILDFDVRKLGGKINLEGEGLRVDNSNVNYAKYLELIGLLSLENLLTSIGNLGKKGLEITKFQGVASIKNGILKWQPYFKAESVALNFQITGTLNLFTLKIDNNVLINFNVAQIIPLAQLLVTVPTGGLVWIFTEQFKSIANYFTTFRYTLTGNINNTKTIKLDKSN